MKLLKGRRKKLSAGCFFAVNCFDMKAILAALALFLLALRAGATIDVVLQMQLGNPSGAIADTNNHNHYLIQRTVEAIDYSDNLGEPVWASWDLTSGDVGSATRSTTYFTDTNLPPNFYQIGRASCRERV